MKVYCGGRSWIVDESLLLNWLSQNAIQEGAPTTVVREVMDGNETGRVLLNEGVNNG